jgi:hypothetical protein
MIGPFFEGVTLYCPFILRIFHQKELRGEWGGGHFLCIKHKLSSSTNILEWSCGIISYPSYILSYQPLIKFKCTCRCLCIQSNMLYVNLPLLSNNLHYVTLFLFPFMVHFISIKPALSNHLSFVTIFHCSL